MEITYLGHSSFRIKGKSAVLVIDPFLPDEVGLKFPKHVEADIVCVSHDHGDHNAVSLVEGNPYYITGPGEYEVKGVGIVGVSSFHDGDKGALRGKNTMYRIEIDGLSIVHLGDLGHVLSSSQVDELDGVNVLLVPVGGDTTIDPAQAVQVTNDIEPDIVIPMHFGRPEIDQKKFGTLASYQVFLKEIGKEGIVEQPKLVVTKDKLPAEMQVVVLGS